jgi:Rit1 N-terminal domain
VPPCAQRSFYKSADGNYAHRNVTPRRPNITLLHEAVPDGGAAGVDVTRAGKIGLDALSKTLPT